DKGRLVKQVTARDEGRRLAFRVVEQGFETHSLRLVDGSFTFEPVDATHTRVTLETTYAPRLRPRWAWRPSEAFTVHTLHEYVLRGMEARGRRVEWAERIRDSDARRSASTMDGVMRGGPLAVVPNELGSEGPGA